MTIVHHPDPSTLMSYAAGTLGEALSAAVACHVDLCPHCRYEMNHLDMIGGLLLQDLAPVGARAPNPPDGVTDNRVADWHAGDRTLPRTLVRVLGGGFDRVPWSFVSPGIQLARLPLSAGSNGMLALIKIAAGRSIPEHGHGGSELTLVLAGGFRDRAGHFSRGDMADLDEDAEHEPVVDPDGECICLLASETKLKFKGVLPRLLQPILGI